MRRALVMALGTMAFLVGSCISATAVTVPKPRTKPFSEIEAGVMLSSTGPRFEDVYRIKRSPDGEGAAVRDGIFGGTTFPVSGTDVVTSNYKDGRQTASETFTLGAPRLDGVGTITGHGRCTGGTNQHQLEKCSYAFTGSYDLRTGVYAIALSGTDSRVTTGTAK